MSKASTPAMEALHGALADTMRDILQKGVTAVDKDSGEIVRLTPGANYLNAIRQFLKDNNVEAAAAQPGTSFGALVESLPFSTGDEPVIYDN